MNAVDVFLLLVAGLVAGFVVGLLSIAIPGPPDGWREMIICEYQGGAMKEDVCIIDDRVVTIDLNKND